MKALNLYVALLIAIVGLSAAFATKAPDRPAGIAAESWYPINERLGLVIPDYQPDLDALVDSGPPGAQVTRARELPPPPGSAAEKPSGTPGIGSSLPAGRWLRGYLMVKEGTHWDRVAIAGSPSLLNQATHRP